jgi:hypothetical protein
MHADLLPMANGILYLDNEMADTSDNNGSPTHPRTAVSTRKQKLVMHRKKPVKIKLSKRPRPTTATAASSNKGLPQTTARLSPPPATERYTHTDESIQQQQDDDDETLQLLMQNAPNDTLLTVQSLLLKSATRLAIPLLEGQQIAGVLESQLYPILQAAESDTAVSQEMQDLLQAGSLCKLTAPVVRGAFTPKKAALSIVVLTADYQRGIQDAVHRHFGNIEIAAWFSEHLSDWTGCSNRIAKTDLEESYQHCSLQPHYTTDQVLQELQRVQVLLPCHANDTYQLWLPEWGTALAAWDRAATKLVQFLKRSQRQERSLATVEQQDAYSPIPRQLLLHWLIIQARVQLVERPYGKFVQLIQ